LKPPHSQPDKKRGAKAGNDAAAQKGAPLEERAGAVFGLYRDERGREPGNTRAAEGVRDANQSNSHESDAASPIVDEPNAAPARDDRNPRGRDRARMQPFPIAPRMSGSMPDRQGASNLGWLRWGLLLPVVGITAWAAIGIVTHGLNGSWRNEESLYRIETPQTGGAGAGGAAKSAAAANGAGDMPAKEPAWKNRATWTDSFSDGTPDFLRLSDTADREAFRQWFTLIADYQAMRPAAQVPKEITDCASLLRYAYREALKKHDAGWFKDTGMEVGALPGEIQAWHYPDTPLGAGLFRVTPGPFVQGDESDGAFAQFADAKTLVERNAYLVSRNVWQAEPGDLLFYRQFGQSSPWHSMIVTRVGSGAAVVYDTGEDHGTAGELRRVELTELLAHPEPEWRPLASNPNFMGVYRWNILRGSL
jgi:uncharacterized protein YfaT (DUF1175 family)